MTTEYSANFYASTLRQGDAAGKVLADILCKADLDFTTIVDVGGGIGGWLQPFVDRGARGFLVDMIGLNSSLVHEKIIYIEQDLREGYDWRAVGPVSLVVCVEVLEHLPNIAAAAILDAISQQTDLVVFSAAWPGQGGVYHINERDLIEWEREWSKRGFVVVDALRQQLASVDAPSYYQSNVFIATSNPIKAWKLIRSMKDAAVLEGGLTDLRMRGARLRGIVLRRLPPSWVTKLAGLRAFLTVSRS